MTKQSANITTDNSEDYSPSSTLIHFDRPLPLLRGPIPAGPTEDPTLGPYILAFPTQKSFFSTFKFCESKLLEQCLSGIRIGCSISASEKCKPPFWKTLFTKPDFKAQSECEEREMEACLVGSREKCGTIAKEKSLRIFGWARVGCRERKLRDKDVGRLISLVSGLGGNDRVDMLMGHQLGSISEMRLSYEVTNVRGFEILEGSNQVK